MEWLLIPVYSKTLAVKSRENTFANLVYLDETLIEAILYINKAIWALQKR